VVSTVSHYPSVTVRAASTKSPWYRCVLGLLLAGQVAPGGDSSGVGSIFELVSRIDGAKMLLFAVVAVSAIARARRVGPLPAWTVYPTVCWRSH
jgi:hypothetical protein